MGLIMRGMLVMMILSYVLLIVPKENVQDWCISRQLWWGHRIPAYQLHIDTDILPVSVLEQSGSFKFTTFYLFRNSTFF